MMAAGGSGRPKTAAAAKGPGRITVARRLVQVAALALFCLPVLAAGWGLFGAFSGTETEVATPAQGPFYGSLASSSVAGVTLLDPLAVLEMAAAAKSFDPLWLVGALPVVLVYGLVRGRAFCGWVCPVNLLGEGADWLRGKLGLPDGGRPLPRRAKIAMAAATVVLSALAAFPLFQAVSPIGAVNKGLAFGGFAGALTLVAVLTCDLLWKRRAWCRSLCPLGGLYQVLGRAGQLNVAISPSECTHCGRCQKACLADPSILQPALSGQQLQVKAGDCMACGACIDACPSRALRFQLGRRGKGPCSAAEPFGESSAETVTMTVSNRT